METFGKSVKRGDRGKDVKLAQEWLSFHGFGTSIDGAFGPATEAVVKAFQKKSGIDQSGFVNVATQDALLAPMVAVHKEIEPKSRSLSSLFVEYARQHLKQHPIEIGGENSGPWVRLYMGGNEGRSWPWCAGFATWVLRQAAQSAGVSSPHPYAYGCDFLAVKGQNSGTFVKVRNASHFSLVKPGYLFLIRRTDWDWTHIGIVESVDGDTMKTIEGNTNDAGSREGFEVCRRTRALIDKDYLMV